MWKLLMLSLTVVALALPAMASADFTHEGAEIGEAGVKAQFLGSAGFVISGTAVGTHCTALTVDWQATRFWSHVTTFDLLSCTTTHPNPALNGLTVDAHPINLSSWKVDADATNNRVNITNVHITNTTTSAEGAVIGSSTLIGGTIHAAVNNNSAITTATLSDTGATAQALPGGTVNEANISGHLTSNGTIGIH